MIIFWPHDPWQSPDRKNKPAVDGCGSSPCALTRGLDGLPGYRKSKQIDGFPERP